MEVYFNVHRVSEEHKITFSPLKLEGHAQILVEIYIETLRLEGDPPITKWEFFKNLSTFIFTTLCMKRTRGLVSTTTDKKSQKYTRVHCII